MNKSDLELARKKTIGFWFLVLVCFFNTVPLFVISVLANLSSVSGLLEFSRRFTYKTQLTVYVPFINKWSETSPVTFAIVSGVLPPAVSGIFGFFLPIIMRWLTKVSSCSTHAYRI